MNTKTKAVIQSLPSNGLLKSLEKRITKFNNQQTAFCELVACLANPLGEQQHVYAAFELHGLNVKVIRSPDYCPLSAGVIVDTCAVPAEEAT